MDSNTLIVPHMSEKNGDAEYENHSIKDIVICMLIDSGLPYRH